MVARDSVKVDTSYISKKYESQLLQGTEPLEVTLGKYQLVPPTEPPVEGEEEEIYRVVPVGDPVKIGAAVPLVDNPVHCKKTLTLTDGSEVGYLMYNSFTAGTKESPEKYNAELREWSDELAQKNIHEVILDLRYNKGGSIDCVQLLSTMLVSSYYLDQTMGFLEYNDKNTDKDVTLTFDSKLFKYLRRQEPGLNNPYRPDWRRNSRSTGNADALPERKDSKINSYRQFNKKDKM